jgi:hypothetical protein
LEHGGDRSECCQGNHATAVAEARSNFRLATPDRQSEDAVKHGCGDPAPSVVFTKRPSSAHLTLAATARSASEHHCHHRRVLRAVAAWWPSASLRRRAASMPRLGSSQKFRTEIDFKKKKLIATDYLRPESKITCTYMSDDLPIKLI